MFVCLNESTDIQQCNNDTFFFVNSAGCYDGRIKPRGEMTDTTPTPTIAAPDPHWSFVNRERVEVYWVDCNGTLAAEIAIEGGGNSGNVIVTDPNSG